VFGYRGKILFINISSQSIEIESTPSYFIKNYLGGRGFGVAFLRDKITLEYFDDAMPLIFAAGPLVATPSPTSGRFSVLSRSPLTGTIFDCSVGGRFGTIMKKAGFDAIVITGKANKIIGIVIEDEKVSFVNSDDKQGLDTNEISKYFSKDYSVASIGLAGERLVRFASIVFDGHYLAGRGGLGAVMGSKRLKFVAIKGTSKVDVKDLSLLKEAQEEIIRLLRASPALFGDFGISKYGTGALVDLIHSRRLEPTENFKETFFKDSYKYDAYTISKQYNTRKTGCVGCPVLCKKKGSKGEIIPEYESLSHFGALNRCSDLSAIVEANRLCNIYGLDTISTASTIACYSEIEGLRLSSEDIITLIKEIACRDTKKGNALAEGSMRFAKMAGQPDKSMSVKSLELPAYDPRGAYGMALAYAVSSRGGCHLRAYPISYEILRKPVAVDRFSFEGKARMVKLSEDLNAVIDSLTACKFLFFSVTLEEYSKVLKAVTGLDYTVQDLMNIGDRICKLERSLNNLNGFDIKDDTLPVRFFTEEGSSSEKIKIPPISKKDFSEALQRYYIVRGASVDGRINKEIS